ncbi:SDR family oxidoreductase [Hyphobacterium sp. CCMP332]|nr:SDR family oxidoreductase [Hyphobacterium sp. CCMP332]
MSNYLIIGASSGIGEGIARKLKEEGHNIFATHNKKPLEIEADASQQWDANSDSELEIIPDQLDGLIYCPGTINLKPFHRIKAEEFQEEMNINYFGAVKAIQQSLKALKNSEQASIVLFSTVAVQNGMPFHASIASAKGAIEGLTRTLAAEFAPKIRVNAIAPSITKTPLAEKLLSNDDKIKASEERHPLKKIGTVEDISNAIEFLIGDKSKWMTGQILHLDGGMSSTRPL